MGPACSGRDFCCTLGGGAREGAHSRQNQPLDRWHLGLLAPLKPGPQKSNTKFFNVCSLSPFSLNPTSVPPPWEHHRRWGFSLVCSAFLLLLLLSQVYQGLLLMTFLSVFQIVSNKSIPRKRPREVALSTFQTFGFPIPFSLLPCSSCLSHLL